MLLDICRWSGKLPSELEGMTELDEKFYMYSLSGGYKRWQRI